MTSLVLSIDRQHVGNVCLQETYPDFPQVFRHTSDRIEIGRGEDQTICLDSRKDKQSVSRKHCIITRHGSNYRTDSYSVSDRNAFNGVYVNGIKLDKWQSVNITEKDTIRVCEYNIRLHLNRLEGPFPKSELARTPQRSDEANGFSATAGGYFQFREGSAVEARTTEEGFRGAWFPGIIREIDGSKRCRIEYADFYRDESPSEKVVDWVLFATTIKIKGRGRSDQYPLVRPVPPKVRPKPVSWALGDKVEAPYEGGMWEGAIKRVEPNGDVIVTFKAPPLGEGGDMHFQPHQVQPALSWLGAPQMAWRTSNGTAFPHPCLPEEQITQSPAQPAEPPPVAPVPEEPSPTQPQCPQPNSEACLLDETQDSFWEASALHFGDLAEDEDCLGSEVMELLNGTQQVPTDLCMKRLFGDLPKEPVDLDQRPCQLQRRQG
ncbi:hypothetical protein CYMTET_16119 [Cymbomonas tetramitiformis]|uniref:FHA domain-containing protein n=1 Tax=Cymbomonas tetramitiformis TaxID=36881 RepID=A0AAE0GD04_9CHLO|nr:hypothetical protein CYMTET_16119 [Cymbomonas tetramitiformis]